MINFLYHINYLKCLHIQLLIRVSIGVPKAFQKLLTEIEHYIKKMMTRIMYDYKFTKTKNKCTV